MRRTILIGDLHGCHDEAVELLDACAASEADRVIFLGDLVDRGPKPRQCVELAMRHECILGNHEEKHLQQRHRADEKLSPDHLATRRALGSEHYAYFETLPAFIELPEFSAAAVHAGALPGIPVSQQARYHLLHCQNIRPPETKSYWPSKAPADYTFWTNHWTGPTKLIFGHSVLTKPLVTPHAVGIDTGCAFGGPLTALVLPDWRLVQVASRQPRRARGNGIATYLLQDDVYAYS